MIWISTKFQEIVHGKKPSTNVFWKEVGINPNKTEPKIRFRTDLDGKRLFNGLNLPIQSPTQEMLK